MASNNDVIAINTAELDKYMLNIIECSNKIKAIFNKIDDEVERLKTCYSCSSASVLYKQYANFNDNYDIIVNNIMSYNTDLMSLKKRYSSALDNLTQKITAEAARLSDAVSVEYKEER